MKKLGVNIDHIATLRQQRKENEPDLISAAKTALDSGADSITIHLREDRRHIQDDDVIKLKTLVPRLNLEMSIQDEMVDFACRIQPTYACLVPEKREELTTEGGLDVRAHYSRIQSAALKLKSSNIQVSLFIDPKQTQIDAAHQMGVPIIERHTGDYARAEGKKKLAQLHRIQSAAKYASQLGLIVNAGHGLKYHDTASIAQIPEINELNIGHSIICRSIFIGLTLAVQEMKKIISADLIDPSASDQS